jgi:hypothetical protein
METIYGDRQCKNKQGNSTPEQQPKSGVSISALSAVSTKESARQNLVFHYVTNQPVVLRAEYCRPWPGLRVHFSPVKRVTPHCVTVCLSAQLAGCKLACA